MIPAYHHAIPKALDSKHAPLSPRSGASDTPMFSAKETQYYDYFDSDITLDDDDDDQGDTSEEKKPRATDDLADYLSHCIS